MQYCLNIIKSLLGDDDIFNIQNLYFKNLSKILNNKNITFNAEDTTTIHQILKEIRNSDKLSKNIYLKQLLDDNNNIFYKKNNRIVNK